MLITWDTIPFLMGLQTVTWQMWPADQAGTLSVLFSHFKNCGKQYTQCTIYHLKTFRSVCVVVLSVFLFHPLLHIHCSVETESLFPLNRGLLPLLRLLAAILLFRSWFWPHWTSLPSGLFFDRLSSHGLLASVVTCFSLYEHFICLGWLKVCSYVKTQSTISGCLVSPRF